MTSILAGAKLEGIDVMRRAIDEPLGSITE